MYFPYLRGRQFELIALRELLERGLISDKIIPIIEPIKINSTLLKTLELFKNKERYIAVICNPQLKSSIENIKGIKDTDIYKDYVRVIQNDKIIKAHVINDKSKIEINDIQEYGARKSDLLIIANNIKHASAYKEIFNEEQPRFCLIPDVLRRRITKNRVLFGDKFNKQERNVDYYDNEDEIFSEDHLFYKDENYLGFSDYSVVGSEFSDSGFAPYAVAIHIVYFGDEYVLNIRHFVSDSNDDISNPANKFYEAVEKLVEWKKTQNINTYALDKFEEHYKEQTYPGLGIVKKLAIMHHIELVNKYLLGVE